MEVIVATVNRAHKIISHERFSLAECRIGRAFDNDCILTEPHVCAHHARLWEDGQGQWWLDDLNSENGILSRSNKPLPNPCAVQSGDEVVIGKVHLKFFRPDHQVDPVIGMSGSENMVMKLSSPFAFVMLLLSALLLFAGLEYSQSFQEIEAKNFAVEVLGIPVIGIIWAGIWALAGRVLRHEPRFLSQCVVSLIYLLLAQFGQELLSVLAFNSGSDDISNYLMYVMHGGLFALLLSFNLRLASYQKPLFRLLTANGLAWSVIGVLWLFSLISESQFSVAPEYGSSLKPPAVKFRSSLDEEVFLQRAESVFPLAEE